MRIILSYRSSDDRYADSDHDATAKASLLLSSDRTWLNGERRSESCSLLRTLTTRQLGKLRTDDDDDDDGIILSSLMLTIVADSVDEVER